MKLSRAHIAAFLLFLCSSGMACPEAADVTSAYGFINLVPPSTLYVVGAVLAIEPTSDGKLDTTSLKLVCGPRSSLGPQFIAMTSQTISQEARTSTKRKWHLSADVLSQVKAVSKNETIEDIEVTLTDAKILTLSDDQLLESLQYRSPECKKAIFARLQAGMSLTMVSSCLVADMTYTVKFRESKQVSAYQRSKEMTAIAVSLGGGHQQITSKQIVSRGLAIGIKTDSFLMVLGVPELRQSGLLEFDDVKMARDLPSRVESTEPDAPVVPPSGAAVSPIYGG